jgi:hypothetical protein
MDEMQIITEYTFSEMPKRRLLELFRQGARIYKICENTECGQFQQYQLIDSDKEFMTYCLHCARKVLLYGLESSRS